MKELPRAVGIDNYLSDVWSLPIYLQYDSTTMLYYCTTAVTTTTNTTITLTLLLLILLSYSYSYSSYYYHYYYCCTTTTSTTTTTSNPNPSTTTTPTTIQYCTFCCIMCKLWCSATFFAIDTRYELIVGGHIYAVQPVVVMLQVVRVPHGIFIRPSELAVWFYNEAREARSAKSFILVFQGKKSLFITGHRWAVFEKLGTCVPGTSTSIIYHNVFFFWKTFYRARPQPTL